MLHRPGARSNHTSPSMARSFGGHQQAPRRRLPFSFLLVIMEAAMNERMKMAGEKREREQQQPAAGALTKPDTLTNIAGNASALNAANPDALPAVLGAGDGVALKSDADEQLIVSLTLPQAAKLTAIRIAGPRYRREDGNPSPCCCCVPLRDQPSRAAATARRRQRSRSSPTS